MATLLQQAINLAKSGDREGAEEMLLELLADQPENEVAWIWLSAVTRDALVKREALQKAVSLNPDNPLVKKGLSRFGGVPAAVAPPSVETPPPVEASPPEPVLPPKVAPSEESVSPPEIEPPSFMDNFGDEEPAVEDDFSDEETPAKEEVATESAAETAFDFSLFNAAKEDPLPGNFDLDTAPPAFDFDPTETATKLKFIDFADDDTLVDSPDTGLAAESVEDLAAPVQDESRELPPAFAFVAPRDEDEPPVESIEEEPVIAPDEPAAQAVIEEPDWVRALKEEDDLEPKEDASIESDFVVAPPPPDLDATDEELEQMLDSKVRARNMRRQQQQTRIMIIGVGVFTLLLACCCVSYIFFTQADTYSIFPQMAGDSLTVEATGAIEGVSTLKFRGFPATRATVSWTRDTAVQTCRETTGLEVEFAPGISSKLNNQYMCSGDVCNYEKELPPGEYTDVIVQYRCASNAVVTLYK